MSPKPSALKVCTIVGTRPEIIRLSRVIDRLDSTLAHTLVHTGQNYDFELNEIFFRELGIRSPDHVLRTDTGSLARFQASVLVETESLLTRTRPSAVLILGDTNSSIACLVARRMKIPVYHMEAGNRCFDPNVPEEINRRVIDHIADFNLCYTEHARRNLIAEGLHPRRIYVTGSPLREVFDHYADAIRKSTVIQDLGLTPGRYYLASLHREENVDRFEYLSELVAAIRLLSDRDQTDVIVSTHPRTRNSLAQKNLAGNDSRLRFLKPFGFIDYNCLQKHARCVLSDSGTVSEESAICTFPAVNVRRATERPEAIDSGGIILAGTKRDSIVEAVDIAVRDLAEARFVGIPAEYQVMNTSQRVVNLIVGTARLSNYWAGVEENDIS